jgi:hypothetical protein
MDRRIADELADGRRWIGGGSRPHRLRRRNRDGANQAPRYRQELTARRGWIVSSVGHEPNN